MPGILIFNWRGLLATVAVGVPVFMMMNRLENGGWSVGPLLVFVAIGMTLPLSLLAYTIDRCDRPGVLRPYWDNFAQECSTAFGVYEWGSFNPDRRTAFCLWPLAVGPYIICLIYVGAWLYWAFTGDPVTLLPYLACTAISCAIAAAYGKATERLRVLPGLEILDDPSDDRHTASASGVSAHNNFE